VFSECAIYFAAVETLRADGRKPTGNPTPWPVPAESAAPPRRYQPDGQRASRIARLPQELYGRMIARGVPSDLADDIARSKAFWDLVAFRDSLIADF